MKKQYHLPVTDSTAKYQNPLTYLNTEKIPTNPDPYVMKYGGRYYCYSSDANGVNVSSSENLREWTYQGMATEEEDKQQYWAPCVFYDNGTFYMYCSNTGKDTDDCHKEFLQLYTSANPIGPFQYQKTFFEKFSIDAHVVRDFDGDLYLFYSVNDYMGTDSERSGTVILVDRLINYTELAGEEKPVVLPTLDEEIFEKNRFGDGRDWHTIEGAFFFRHRRKAYLMYAANAYVRENYYLGYSTANAGHRISEMSWMKYPNNDTYHPFVRRNEKVEGTGHNSVVKAPNMVDDWIIYHGRNQEEPLIEGVEQRKMRMDPILYCGDRMVTNAPSYLEQEAPEMPLFATYEGVDNEEFLRCDTQEGCFHILKNQIENYVLEADVVAYPTHMGALYGIILMYEDDQNYLELLIDSGKRKIIISETKQNICKTVCEKKLPVFYKHDVLHHLRVERCAHRFEIELDYCHIFSEELHSVYGEVGTVEKHTEVKWCSFAITEHADFYGKKLQDLSSILVSDKKMHFIPACETQEDKLRGTFKSSITLTELKEFPDAQKSIEFLLETPNANVKVDNGSIVVEVERTGFKVYSSNEEGECLKYEFKNEERFITVYLKQRNHKTYIYVNGIYVEKDSKNEESEKMKISLFQSSLTGYDYTKLCK